MIRVIAPFLVIVCAFATDPEWPGFRGPSSNPSATNSNLPEKWSKTVNIEWTATLPGLGWSSPIVVGRNIFLTTVTPMAQRNSHKSARHIPTITLPNSRSRVSKGRSFDPASSRAISNCLTKFPFIISFIPIDLQSGEINWKREFYAGHPPGGRHRKNSFCSETPVTDGKRVYVYINNLGLFAYDLDGNQVWNTLLENLPTILDFGTASSPTLVNDLVDHRQRQRETAIHRGVR